jgi:hypothetical protein
MKHIILLSYLLVLAACKNESSSNNGASGFSSESDKASASFTKDEVSCTNQFYKYVQVGKDKKPVLLQITQKSMNNIISPEKFDGEYHITAYGLNGDKMDKKLWDKTIHADIIGFEPRFIQLTRAQRGESEESSRLFNYFTGEQILTFSGVNAIMAIPNSEEKRLIGFTALSNDQNLLEKEGNDIVGVLEYSSIASNINKVKVRAKNVLLLKSIMKFAPGMSIEPKNEEDKVMEGGRTVVLSSLSEKFDPEKIGNLFIHLTFFLQVENQEITITIPIEKDKLDISKAIYDKNIFVLEN